MAIEANKKTSIMFGILFLGPGIGLVLFGQTEWVTPELASELSTIGIGTIIGGTVGAIVGYQLSLRFKRCPTCSHRFCARNAASCLKCGRNFPVEISDSASPTEDTPPTPEGD
jgi:hypothetical protein